MQLLRQQLSDYEEKLRAVENSTSWTRAELAERRDIEIDDLPPSVNEAFNDADADGDGKVSVKEILEQRSRHKRRRAHQE